MKTPPKTIHLKQLQNWFKAAVDDEAPGRKRSEEEIRALYNDPWTKDQRNELESRGQTAVSMNQLHQDFYVQLGRQIRDAASPTVKARGPSDAKVATGLTDVIRYILDANLWEWVQTDAVKDQLQRCGWLKVCYQKEDLTAEPIAIHRVPWRNVYANPRNQRKDLLAADDWVAEERWVELCTLTAEHPDKAGELEAYASTAPSSMKPNGSHHEQRAGDAYAGAAKRGEAGTADWVDRDRQYVRVVEMWYRLRIQAQQLIWPDGRVELYDEQNPAHVEATSPRTVVDPQTGALMLAESEAEVVTGPYNAPYYIIFAGDVILAQGRSPYTHPYFPYVYVEAFRADVAERNEYLTPGERFGMLRVALDPQRFVNSLYAKMRFILGTRQVLAKPNVDRATLEQNASNPAGIIPINEAGDVTFVDQLQHAQGLDRLLDRALSQMERATGVNEASRGQGPESSGRAMFARQQQSEVTNTILAFNLRHAVCQIGRMLVAMVQQSYHAEKILRITEDGGDRLIAVNVTEHERAEELRAKYRTVEEDGSESDGITIYGALGQGFYDVKVDDMEATATRREADFEVLMTILEKLPPEFVVAMADVLVENLDIRAKDKFIERARALQARLMGPQPGAAPPPEAMPPGAGPPPDPGMSAIADMPPQPELPPEAAMLPPQEPAASLVPGLAGL